jgi:hypothetical protein
MMRELTHEFLRWAALVSPGFLVVSVLVPVSFAFRRRRWAIVAFGLIAVQFVAEEFHALMVAGLTGLALEVGAVVFLARGWLQSTRLHTAWMKQMRAETAVVLQAPFEGRWKALGTGPWAALNHHLAASDQWFAVDWLRVDGESRGSRVLAPVDGVVVHMEDGHPDKPARRWIQRDIENPAGNYVSLRVDGRENAFVILAHLEMGSIGVWPGQTVRVGDPIGLCGNSGNTTRPHLHVHAQPAERTAPGLIWGIPIVFGGRPEWMQRGEMLEGAAVEPAADPAGT